MNFIIKYRSVLCLSTLISKWKSCGFEIYWNIKTGVAACLPSEASSLLWEFPQPKQLCSLSKPTWLYLADRVQRDWEGTGLSCLLFFTEYWRHPLACCASFHFLHQWASKVTSSILSSVKQLSWPSFSLCSGAETMPSSSTWIHSCICTAKQCLTKEKP